VSFEPKSDILLPNNAESRHAKIADFDKILLGWPAKKPVKKTAFLLDGYGSQ